MLEGNFVTFVAQDQGVEARAVLQDDLSQRVLEHLEERKRELAAGLFSGHASEPVQEESEQLDEISAATAYSAGRKRLAQGQGLTNASLDAEKDPKHAAYTSKQYAKQADTAFDKAKKNYGYALKKDKIGVQEESEQLDEGRAPKDATDANTEDVHAETWIRATKAAKKNGTWKAHHEADPHNAIIPHPDAGTIHPISGKPVKWKYARYIRQSVINSRGRDRSDVDKYGRRKWH
jgi:hypothetical protein